MDYKELDRICSTLSKEDADALIEWRARDIRVLKRYYRLDTITKGAHMQYQITIELRVDFADRDKLPEIKKSALAAGRHLYATAQLISDTPKTTQIAVYGNDFFSKPEEIKLLDDLIAKGVAATHLDEAEDMGNISEELISAVTENSHIPELRRKETDDTSSS